MCSCVDKELMLLLFVCTSKGARCGSCTSPPRRPPDSLSCLLMWKTDWQDRATLEARMSATEEYRAQAEARNRLEDTWKAGQEAAMFRWRAERHVTQKVRGVG